MQNVKFEIEESPVTGARVGDVLEVEISDIAFGGEGVARVEGLVIFVPFVITGETARVEVTERKKDFARAKLIEVLQPAPERVDAPCTHFGACGGCQYQHIDYPAQVRIKLDQVRNLFARVGGFEPDIVGDMIPCPAPLGYRNRIMVRRQWDKFKQRAVYGFLRHDNRLVVDMDRCEIAEPALNEQLNQLRDDPPPRNMQKVVLRIMPDEWELHRDSFFQNNFHLLPQLVEAVRGCLANAGTRHLVDAYCGIGFFSLSLADLVESFVGVDIDKQCILPARENMKRRGVTNGDFILGKTEEHMSALLERFQVGKTTVILDPPRKGCHKEGLEMLASAKPQQVIYVSCHPATLARDLKWLGDNGGYELKGVTPLDMFPQTQHVECVADLRRP